MADSRDISNPQPGFWLAAFVRGGPLVPCSIVRVDLSREPGNEWNELDRWPRERLVAYVVDAEVWIDRVWLTRGTVIDRPTHDYLVADIQWCRRHRPDDPRCRPFRPIQAYIDAPKGPGGRVDLGKSPPVF